MISISHALAAAIEISHLPAGSEPMEKSKKTRGRGIERDLNELRHVLTSVGSLHNNNESLTNQPLGAQLSESNNIE